MLILASVASSSPPHCDSIPIDEALFPQIAEGSKDAFCTLYQLTKGAVYAYALSLLRNQTDAEDALQETFLKIRSAAHLYQPQNKPMAWILTITRNICLMKFRQQKHRADLPLEDAEQLPDFSRIENIGDRIVLETAFQVLSKEESEIVMLHAVADFKHREISEMLRLPLATVLSKYNRAIKKVRKQLEGRL